MEIKTILEDCKSTILLEISELESLFNRLNDDLAIAIQKINQGKGKLVVVGIGKSAHIAGKIVATLNSTGTTSQFLHAAEAVHGDLGLVNSDDVVLCISNSGNSPEIKNVVPFLKKKSSFLIGMTGNLNSFLAQQSDVVLDSSVSKEACPNNLAPTTSTTVQIALGDAIAVALMNLKQFKSIDFAQFHPGGALGKNLLWNVEQILQNEDKPNVKINSTIKEVINSLAGAKSGITVVMNDLNEIQGVITDGDLKRMLVNHDNFNHLIAENIMSINPKTVEKNELAKTAYDILNKYDIGQLIVLNQGNYFGILDIHQLFEQGIK